MSVIKGVMRQMEEKYCRNEISFLIWSNKLDLIAVASTVGEVIVHRLNWQHVWHLPAPDKDVVVKMIAWGPDGRVLSIAYSTNEIYIVNVEKKLIVNKIKMNSAICYLNWVEEETTKDRAKKHYFMMKDTQYLTELAPFMGSDGNEIPDETFVKLKNQKKLNFLVIGLECGEVRINIFGILPCGVVDINKYIPSNSPYKIVYANVTKNLKQLFVLLKVEDCESSQLHCAIFDIFQLCKYSSHLFTLAHHCANLLSIIDYMDYAIHSIVEAWENILISEMMLKLNDYAEGKEEGILSAEFLELLLFGTYRQTVQKFLIDDVTENQLKRISTSIEMSHSSMTKLVIQHLRPATENLMFDITILRGVTKCITRTTNPVMTDKIVNNCLVASGAVHVKTNEMLCVLEESQIKYKAFFRWLGVIYAIFAEERLPTPSVADITQREIKFITDYLYNIERLCGKPGQRKEELGQYLVDENLTTAKEKKTRNSWVKFLKENPCLAEQCPTIILPIFEEFSLIQQQTHLKKQMQEFFLNYDNYVTSQCSLVSTFTLFTLPGVSVPKIIASVNDENLLVAVTKIVNTNTYLDIFEVTKNGKSYMLQSIYLSFEEDLGYSYQLIDMQFYTNTVLSLILDQVDDGECSYYTQLPIDSIRQSFDLNEPQNIFGLISKDLRIIENMKVCRIAVSGARKVLVAISDDGHKVRVFEMEAEDEEDVTNITTSSADMADVTGTSRIHKKFHSSGTSTINNDSDDEDLPSESVLCKSHESKDNTDVSMENQSASMNREDESEMSLDISSLSISPINTYPQFNNPFTDPS